jgi:D-glycero-alpha-D-manno-heptose-7-phosphate kinase
MHSMIISQTPLRVSFLGGGTDYPEHFEQHGGAVLGTAVDKNCYFTVAPLPRGMLDYRLRIAYRKVECVQRLEDLEHRPFRECLRWTGLTRDTEVTHMAEVPAMTGLGSSSSFSVGLLNAIYAHQKRPLSPLELAYHAIDFERGVLRESVGCQDQTFAAVGGFNLIEFRALGDFVVHRVALSPERLRELESHLLCFFTGIRRRAEVLARAQTHRVSQNRARLAQMRELVDDGYRILTGTGSLAPFGELLHQSWMLKRELAREVTSPEIDRWYRDAIDAGAIGGKLLGAGGGGFLLFFAPPETHDFIRMALPDFSEVSFRLDAPGSRVVFNSGSEAQQLTQQGANAPRSPAFKLRLLEVG